MLRTFIGERISNKAMTIKTKLSILSILLILLIGFLPISVSASGDPAFNPQVLNYDLTFGNSQKNVPNALYLNESTTFQIVQQPVENDVFVTSFPNYVTEYRAAYNFGTIGLLAHNYLAGQYFFQISTGQELELVYSDTHTQKFVVTEIKRYQALSPNSPSSDFIDLDTGKYLTAPQLFNKVYRNQTGHLVLQTCIYAEQNPTWGRLFIIAEPVR